MRKAVGGTRKRARPKNGGESNGEHAMETARKRIERNKKKKKKKKTKTNQKGRFNKKTSLSKK